MMDIAEIRKKAKARAPSEAGEQSPEQVVTEDAFAAGPSAGAGADSTQTQNANQPAVEPEHGDAIDSADNSSGLERLFACCDNSGPEAEESFDDLIEYSTVVQAQSSCQYLAFQLDNEEYALDIKQINEIIKVREFTDIPRAPEFVLGIISLRGVVVPVFDLRRRLNLGRSETTSSSRIIVCQVDDTTIGLLVDSINQVVSLIDEEIEPAPGILTGLDREMVSGIGRFQGRMIILLNLPNVFAVELYS